MTSSKKICAKGMTYEDCELAILRMQVDQAQDKMARRVVQSPEIKKLFEIVENFIQKKPSSVMAGLPSMHCSQPKIKSTTKKLTFQITTFSLPTPFKTPNI